MLDVERSVAVAKRIGAEKKACWYNALLAFLVCEEFQTGWYVEGWAIPDLQGLRLNLEHGWVELEDGSIIDPTYAGLGDKHVLYFPAIRYSYKEAAKLSKGKKSVTLPLVARHGSGGYAHPAYLEAYKASFKAAFGKDVDKSQTVREQAQQETEEKGGL